MSSDFPADLKYTSEHEWLRVQGNVCTIGITSFAAEQLGDVVAVELPEEGDTFEKEEVIGTIESVKAVSDLFIPVSGKVIAVNSPLNDSPEYVNEDTYDEGWMVQIEMTDPAQVDSLMDAAAYAKLVAEEDA